MMMAMAMVINSLHAGNLRHMRIHCTDQRLDQVVLLRTCRIFADYYDHDNDDQNTKCFKRHVQCFYYSTKSIHKNHLCPRPYQQAIPREKRKWSQRLILSLARPLHSTRCTQPFWNWFFFFQLLFVT